MELTDAHKHNQLNQYENIETHRINKQRIGRLEQRMMRLLGVTTGWVERTHTFSIHRSCEFWIGRPILPTPRVTLLPPSSTSHILSNKSLGLGFWERSRTSSSPCTHSNLYTLSTSVANTIPDLVLGWVSRWFFFLNMNFPHLTRSVSSSGSLRYIDSSLWFSCLDEPAEKYSSRKNWLSHEGSVKTSCQDSERTFP